MVRMHSSANYSFDMQKAHISAEEEMEENDAIYPSGDALLM